ncbi:ABC transporter permease [Ohtaekwangia koreensis]|uniref:Putative ABC transport system permease protein n=1 Tax=Ohtaekwangia koreensis TaxID=688867 RepID=A0A1T5JIE8_9BACT|nr:ABC transporter permease [Ohtaekwangia koreensis]SKC51220.1 putative ABC transport system permease protein [Ohtaekwangia koreensis]
MSIFTLVWNYLKARPLNTAINILLLSLGIAVITILLLFNKQLEQKITENARGIDLVVGAKGSPLQLILCNIFHVDFPTGNIKLNEAERFAKHRLVKRAIPLALGDSYQSYRIVGTSQQYAELYKAELQEGNWWKNTLDVTIGANVATIAQLKIGDKFASAHGLAEGGHTHNEHQYHVVGVMKRTNTVLDNLILTNVESVWEMHEEHDSEEAHEDHAELRDSSFIPSPLVPSIAKGDSVKEITSMLIQYRSPMGAIQLPRLVNSQSSLQAASPAFETARLFSIMGVGVDILMAFAYVLIFISGLSIFIALYNSLKERRYDLAIMRSMGASRTKLFVSILLEGGILTLLGSVIGLLMGHGVLVLLSALVEETQKAGIDGFVFYPEEWIILVGSLLLGLLCAVIPAIQAYRTDISKVLAGN